jgi:hypothetical protein
LKNLQVLVGKSFQEDIYAMEGDDFEIVEKSSNNNGNLALFRVNTTNEFFLLLKLKYGEKCVWER